MLDRVNGDQKCSNESQKMTLGREGTYLKSDRVIAQKVSTYSFSEDVEEVR